MNEEDLKGFIESHMKKNKMSSYEWDSYQKEEEYWRDAMNAMNDVYDTTIILRIWWLVHPSSGVRWKFTVWPNAYDKVKIEGYQSGKRMESETRTGCEDFGREQWTDLVRSGCIADGTDSETMVINTRNYDSNYALKA